ncbi:MAG TPA: response regulator [bacterium]|nr:response regulator [bacterium]
MSVSLKDSKKTIEILHVEDNAGDALLMKELLKTSSFPIHLSVARDGETALDMLRDGKAFSGKGKPDIVLLDISLPRLSGLEVLAEIRKDKNLHEVPVLIMSASQKDQDLQNAYQNQANFYIVKPMDMDHFSVVMTYIEKFWLSRVQ